MFTQGKSSPKFFTHFLIGLISLLLISMVACIPPEIVVTPTTTATETPMPTATPTPTPLPTLTSGDNEYTMTVSGLERKYLLHIPPGVDGSKPLPILFALPAYDIEVFFEISDMQYVTRLSDISDQNGFLLVFASGFSGTWNAGSCCGAAADQKVDENAFFKQMLVDIGKIAPIDPKRVYVVGYQLGGMMAYRLACEMSDTFAGIASVAGGLTFSPCQPAQPVSIIQIHGLKDLLVPYQGGVGGLMGGKTTFLSVQDTIASWVQLDGCTGSPQTDKQGTIGTHTVYSTCKGGSAIELYVIDGLGNNWPTQYVMPASQMIWDFFKAHPKP